MYAVTTAAKPNKCSVADLQGLTDTVPKNNALLMTGDCKTESEKEIIDQNIIEKCK